MKVSNSIKEFLCSFEFVGRLTFTGECPVKHPLAVKCLSTQRAPAFPFSSELFQRIKRKSVIQKRKHWAHININEHPFKAGLWQTEATGPLSPLVVGGVRSSLHGRLTKQSSNPYRRGLNRIE